MICRHCGREIALIRPLGAMHDDDRIFVHVVDNLARCSLLGPYPYAEPDDAIGGE